jgi:RNA polymerase sigma-70 factor (ECF subfamily)
MEADDARLIELLERIGRSALPLTAREQAFRALYDLTAARMYGLALRVVVNRDWAEDVLQEAFLNVWRIADTYRDALSPPLAWMGVIVRSRALDFLRRRASERADSAIELDAALADVLPASTIDPLDTRQASETAKALHDCLRQLDARQRQVLGLAYLRDLSHSELAQQLQLPLGTVKSWVRRGIEQLRGCMSRYA